MGAGQEGCSVVDIGHHRSLSVVDVAIILLETLLCNGTSSHSQGLTRPPRGPRPLRASAAPMDRPPVPLRRSAATPIRESANFRGRNQSARGAQGASSRKCHFWHYCKRGTVPANCARYCPPEFCGHCTRIRAGHGRFPDGPRRSCRRQRTHS